MKIPIVFFLVATLFVSAMHAQTDKFTTFRDYYLKEVRDAGIVGSSFVFLKDG